MFFLEEIGGQIGNVITKGVLQQHDNVLNGGIPLVRIMLDSLQSLPSMVTLLLTRS